MKRNKKKGFTLVELIAVIAILAILAAVIVPKVSDFSAQATKSALKADASTILNSIEIYNTQVDGKTYQLIDTDSDSILVKDLKTNTPYGCTNAQLANDPAKNLVQVVNRLKGNSELLDKKLNELKTYTNATN